MAPKGTIDRMLLKGENSIKMPSLIFHPLFVSRDRRRGTCIRKSKWNTSGDIGVSM